MVLVAGCLSVVGRSKKQSRNLSVSDRPCVGTRCPLTRLISHAKLACMKGKKEPPKKPTAGTVTGAKYRARCNRLNDTQRQKLGEEFLKLYYGGNPHQPARRR